MYTLSIDGNWYYIGYITCIVRFNVQLICMNRKEWTWILTILYPSDNKQTKKSGNKEEISKVTKRNTKPFFLQTEVMEKSQKGTEEKLNHLRGGSTIGFISISPVQESPKFLNFSPSLAIWISRGLTCWMKALTIKRGASAATVMPSKHNQNLASPAAWKMALQKWFYM